MKNRRTLIIAGVFTILALSSCSATLPTRFDQLSSSVEKNGENYTLQKWERKNDKFANYCTEYKDNFKKYNSTQRRRIYGDMATYVKSAAKAGVVTTTDVVTEIANQITDMVEEGKGLLESLGITKRKDKEPRK